MINIGIVILTWNSDKVIINCLKSIEKLNKYSIKVIVIDNGSQDKTLFYLDQMKRELKYLEIIKCDKNYGTTISRNIGIKRLSDCDYIMILDSDTVVNETAIDLMIKTLNERLDNGIVGPRMLSLDGQVQKSGRKIPTLKIKLYKVLPVQGFKDKSAALEFYQDFGKKEVMPVGYLMSACWLIKQEVIQKIGYLDEKIFYAPEDVEYCIRAWQNGYRVLYSNEAEIIHEWQRLSRKKLISKHNWEHIKGLCYLFKKYKYCFHADKIEIKVK